MNRNESIRITIALSLISIAFLIAIPVRIYASTYNVQYSISYAGVPFSGSTIVLDNNFTNTGQLTVRIMGISLASDFWSNGTRRVSSGLQFNLTAGTHSEVDTPVLIPASALVGDHLVTSTASWQSNNSSGWFDASPIITRTTITVSQPLARYSQA